jgi:hypothetical protein
MLHYISQNYDLIVDTTYALPDKIAECILDAYEIWCADKSYRAAFISPERINYPDDATDAQLISELSDLIELGEKIPEVVLAERDGEFYAVDGIPSALAYALAGKQFVPARLTSYTSELDGINFVKMKNSL